MHRGGLAGGLASLALVATMAAAAPSLDEYGKLPAVEQMKLSPAGDLIASIATNGETRVLVVRKVGETAALTMVGAGKLKVRDILWLDDDHVLITTTGTLDVDPASPAPKAELANSSIVNVRTSKIFTVFQGEQKVLHTTFGLYGVAHLAGKTFAYFGGLPLSGGGSASGDFDNHSGYISSTHIDLYKVDVDGGHPTIAAGGGEQYTSGWVVGPDGQIVAHSEYDFRTGGWRLYDDPADEHLIEKQHDPVGEISLDGLGERPGAYIVNQGDGADGWRLEEFTAGTDEPGKPVLGGAPLKAALFDESTWLLIGGVTADDDARTILIDPAAQGKFDKVRRLFAGEIVSLESFTSGLDQMVVLTDGPQDSGTYFLIDIAAGKAQAIGWAYPGVLPADVGPSRIVPYKAADGLAMEGVLTLPPGSSGKNLPLVVLPHGGPQERDYLGFDWWAQAFASRGYAVFQPNFRGSDGFGPAFRDAGYAQWGRKMQTDISDGVAELARQGIVDPKRACIVGASYGGYAALAGVTVQQGLYRCAVSVAGVADLSRFLAWEPDNFGLASAAVRDSRLFLGAKGPGDASLNQISPARLAARADAPVLLIHGKDDSVVPIIQSRDMRDALRGAHKEVELIELASEDHWLSRSDTRTQMLSTAMAFVEKHNPPN